MKFKVGQRAKVKDGLIFVYLTKFVGEWGTISNMGKWSDGKPFTEITYRDGTRIKWRTQYVIGGDA